MTFEKKEMLVNTTKKMDERIMIWELVILFIYLLYFTDLNIHNIAGKYFHGMGHKRMAHGIMFNS